MPPIPWTRQWDRDQFLTRARARPAAIIGVPKLLITSVSRARTAILSNRRRSRPSLDEVGCAAYRFRRVVAFRGAAGGAVSPVCLKAPAVGQRRPLARATQVQGRVAIPLGHSRSA